MSQKVLLPQVIILLEFIFFCPAVNAQEFPYLAEIITEKINIRSGQNENFEKIGKLNKGDQVVVVGRSYAWDKIKLPPGADSYIAGNFVQDLGDGIGMLKGDRVNVRAGRGTTFAVIGSLKKGTLVRILEQKDGWVKIEPVEGVYGWVLTEYLRFVSTDIPPVRAIELPVNSTRRAAAKPALSESIAAPAEISAEGIITVIPGQKVSEDIQYQISGPDKDTYFLQGAADILGNFTGARVRVEGKLQPQLKLQKSVLLVNKIQLLL